MILVIGGAYQGKYRFVKNNICSDESKIFNCFHSEMKKYIDEGKEPKNLVNEIFNKGYEVVISDEIGCGIVPIKSCDREWREETGKALCDIAKKSKQVWRVYCGIGTLIKNQGSE